MKPSTENQIATAKQEAGAPSKQFTREEIEKHDKDSDCWIVVDNKVYDATSVLDWHPGGKAAVMSHAGKVHAETSSEFESIHDGYAYQKLKGESSSQMSWADTDSHRMHPRHSDRQGCRFHQTERRSCSEREGTIIARLRKGHAPETQMGPRQTARSQVNLRRHKSVHIPASRRQA